MPTWFAPAVAILGSGALASLLVSYVHHSLQQRRERETRAARVAHQRNLCAALLNVVLIARSALHIMEPIHDNPPSRFTAKRSLELALQRLTACAEGVRKIRQELHVEPNAQLPKAIERYGDAAIAYQQALWHPMSSPWDAVQFSTAKTPPDELGRLSHELDMRTEELQAAVRDYLASLEQPAKKTPARWITWDIRS